MSAAPIPSVYTSTDVFLPSSCWAQSESIVSSVSERLPSESLQFTLSSVCVNCLSSVTDTARSSVSSACVVIRENVLPCESAISCSIAFFASSSLDFPLPSTICILPLVSSTRITFEFVLPLRLIYGVISAKTSSSAITICIYIRILCRNFSKNVFDCRFTKSLFQSRFEETFVSFPLGTSR